MCILNFIYTTAKQTVSKCLLIATLTTIYSGKHSKSSTKDLKLLESACILPPEFYYIQKREKLKFHKIYKEKRTVKTKQISKQSFMYYIVYDLIHCFNLCNISLTSIDTIRIFLGNF